MTNQVAISTTIEATPAAIWRALTDPEIVKSYFFGAEVRSSWEAGSPITWVGEYEGKPFRDKGTIIAAEPQRRLEMTHWSPLSGLEDTPENYHTVIWEIAPQGERSEVTLTQRNLTGMKPEDARKSWQPVLDGLKRVVES